jgi:hypothetical protein
MLQTDRNIQEIEDVSKIIGATKQDLQLLDIARDFNEYLKLDSEQLIFALLKKGMKPNISSIFTLSEKNIRSKVRKAEDQNIIPDNLDIDFQIYLLIYRINSYIASQFSGLFTEIGDTQLSSLSSQEKSTIVKKIIEYTYHDKILDKSFYDELFNGATPLVNNEAREKVKRFLDYRDLCYGNNLFIKTFVVSGSLGHIDNLLKLDKNAISQRITDEMLNDVGLPDEILQSETNAIAREKYTDHIYQQIETRHATRSLFLKLANYSGTALDIFNLENNTVNMFDACRTKLVDDESDASNNTATLLLDTVITVQENGESVQRSFDIEKDICRDYVNNLGSGNAFIKTTINETGFTKDDFIRVLSGVQRVYFLAKENKFDVIIALLKNNYRSAYDVVKAGRTKLFKTLKNDLTEDKTINYVYNAAETKVNKALALLSKYSQSSNTLMSSVVRSKTMQKDDVTTDISVLKMPELETLFGSQDVTDTKHGDSVFGPAAYLVDLLNLLKQIEVTDSSTLYDKLIERRPDIAEIPLDCQNAIALVPYIDLVIEILEQWIAEKENILPDTGEVFWEWKTKSDEETLKADPDYCAYPVYDEVINNYSWKQPPFDFKNEELKLYTQAMNVDRVHWANVLNIAGNLDSFYDVLGFNSIDKNFFDVDIETPNTFVDKILSSVQYVTETNGEGHLPRIYISELLENTGLTLKEFEKILDSYFVNPEVEGARFTIHFSKKIELENAFLEIADVNKAKTFIFTMYQYQRLQKATKWANHLLDAILLSVDSTLDVEDSDISKGVNFVISDEQVKKVGRVKKIQNDFKLSDNQIAALFGKVSNHEYKDEQSYINWLFNDNDLPQKQKDEFTKLMNGGNTCEYVNDSIYQTDGTLHSFMQYVCSILQFDIDDIKELEFLFVNNKINRNGVVNLIRYSYLLSVFNISINELLAYLLLTGVSNLSFDVLTNTFNDLEKINDQKFSLEQALYLLKGETLKDSTVVVPTEDDLHTTARKLFSIVQSNKIAEESNTSNEIKAKLIEEIVSLESTTKVLVELIADKSSGNDFYNYIAGLTESDSVKISIQQYDSIQTYFSNYSMDSEIITEDEKNKIKVELIDLVFLDEINKEVKHAKETIVDTVLLEEAINEIKANKEALIEEFILAQIDGNIQSVLDEKAGLKLQVEGSIITEKLSEIQKAVLFVKQVGFTKEILEDYFAAGSNVPVNIYALNGTDFNSVIMLLWSLKASKYLNSPSEPFTFYKTFITGTKTETIKLFKWSDSFKK